MVLSSAQLSRSDRWGEEGDLNVECWMYEGAVYQRMAPPLYVRGRRLHTMAGTWTTTRRVRVLGQLDASSSLLLLFFSFSHPLPTSLMCCPQLSVVCSLSCLVRERKNRKKEREKKLEGRPRPSASLLRNSSISHKPHTL
jgi:hypothetical protein